MGIDDIEDPGKDDLVRVLGYDAREPSSIFASWAAARDNARRAREVIPAELWQCINTTWHNLPSGRLQLQPGARLLRLGPRAERAVLRPRPAAPWSATTAGSICCSAAAWSRRT